MRRTKPELWAGILLALAACEGPLPAAIPPPAVVNWPRFGGEPGTVTAIAVGEDGTVYVGGPFTRIGPMSGGGVPLDSSTGTPFPRFAAVDGTVRAVTTDGAGGWYVGGSFARVGKQPRANLAHVLADGSLDALWAADVAVAPSTSAGAPTAVVWALAFDEGVLYVAGHFDSVGGVSRSGLAALDPAGQVTDWAPATTVPGDVVTLAARGGTVYLAGSFDTVNDTPRARLAAVDAAGALTGWNPGVDGQSDWVSALTVIGDTVYLGGSFESIGGQQRTGLAAVDLAGATLPWAPQLGLGAVVSAGTPTVSGFSSDGTTLYVGGLFERVDGQPRGGLAAFDATGQLTPWAPALDYPYVRSLTVLEGRVYTAGSFTLAGGLPRKNFAAFDAAGKPTNWDPDSEDRGDAFAFCVSAAPGGVYVGGAFRWMGKATQRAGLAAVLPDGRVTEWNPGVGGGAVRALAVAGGVVYVGGQFDRVGGVTRHNLAAVDATGAVMPWNPDPNGPVYALQPIGDLVYVGGRFSMLGGQPRGNLAAVDRSGQPTAWNPVANSLVTSLALDRNRVYAGGYFTGVGGLPRTNLAAIDASGTVLPWTAPTLSQPFGYAGLDPASNQLTGVWSVSVHAGTVYFLGDFHQVGGQERNLLAAVDATGALLPFSAPRTTSPPHSMRWGVDSVLLGGTFDRREDFESGSAWTASLWMVDPASSGSFASAMSTLESESPFGTGDPPFVQAIDTHGDVAYLGGSFWGSPKFDRRLNLAAVDPSGNVTPWDPNAFP